jgi:hypothetical protein
MVLDGRTRARFVPVTVWQVRPETADAVTLVLDVGPAGPVVMRDRQLRDVHDQGDRG